MTTPTSLEHHMAAAKAVVESLGGSERFEAAFLSGSRANGLDHRFSDTDVHVILEDGARLGRRSYEHDGCRVQLTPMRLSDLERVAQLTSKFVATAADRSHIVMSQEQMWHVVRMARAKTLYASQRCAALMAQCDLDVVRQLLMANFAHRVLRAAEDAIGMLAVGDRFGAAHAAQVSLNAACEVAAASAGQTYAVDRFLLRRWSQSPTLQKILPDVWELLSRWPAWNETPAHVEQWIVDCLHAASALSGWSLVEGWDQPPAGKPELAIDRRGGPVRAPAFGLQRFTDCFALAGPGRSLRIGEPVAALWLRLDGRPLDQVAASLVEAGYGGVTEEKVASQAERLIKAGAATSGDAPEVPPSQ